MTICHELVGSIYFQTVHDNLVMDWSQVCTSNHFMIILKIKPWTGLKYILQTSPRSKLSWTSWKFKLLTSP